jgi:protein O-GlcNAc transferase
MAAPTFLMRHSVLMIAVTSCLLPPSGLGSGCLSLTDWNSLSTQLREKLQPAYQTARTQPMLAEAQGRLGMKLQAHAENWLALACYQKAQALQATARSGAGKAASERKRLTNWAYYLGALQASTGDYQAAKTALRHAVEFNPSYEPARLRLAQSLLETGYWLESRQEFLNVLKQNPRSAQAHYGLGRIAAAQGKAATAVEQFLKACKLAPAFGAAHYALALAYRDQSQEAEAQKELALFGQHRDRLPPLKDPLLEAIEDLKSDAYPHLERGFRLREQRQIRDAVTEFEKALQADPQSARAHAALLACSLDLGDPAKAEHHYQEAMRLGLDSYEAHHNYGVALTLQGRRRESAEAFRRALDLNPFYTDSHNNLAFLLADEGDVENASRHFHLAIENRPNFRFAHFGLGQLLLNQGKVEEAIQHFQQIVDVQDEKTPLFLLNLALAHAKKGDQAEARRRAQQARQQARSLGQSQRLTEIDQFLSQLDRAGLP